MRVVILAGGKGIRLAPLTEVIPKPLVPIGGMPILEIVIRQLQTQGFRRISLAVGYLSDLIRAFFQDGSKWGVSIDYSYEESPLGTAGPLALIDGLDNTFLMMNADVLTDLNYKELLNFHRAQGGIATVSAYEREVKIDLGVIIKDGHYRIANYVEKPISSHLVSMGVYVFEPAVLDYIREITGCSPQPKTRNSKLETLNPKPHGYLDFPELIKLLIQSGEQVNYYSFNGFWLDIGRHEDYATACREFQKLQNQIIIARGEKETSINEHILAPSQ